MFGRVNFQNFREKQRSLEFLVEAFKKDEQLEFFYEIPISKNKLSFLFVKYWKFNDMSKSTQLQGFDLNHRALGIFAKKYY